MPVYLVLTRKITLMENLGLKVDLISLLLNFRIILNAKFNLKKRKDGQFDKLSYRLKVTTFSFCILSSDSAITSKIPHSKKQASNHPLVSANFMKPVKLASIRI